MIIDAFVLADGIDVKWDIIVFPQEIGLFYFFIEQIIKLLIKACHETCEYTLLEKKLRKYILSLIMLFPVE